MSHTLSVSHVVTICNGDRVGHPPSGRDWRPSVTIFSGLDRGTEAQSRALGESAHLPLAAESSLSAGTLTPRGGGPRRGHWASHRPLSPFMGIYPTVGRGVHTPTGTPTVCAGIGEAGRAICPLLACQWGEAVHCPPPLRNAPPQTSFSLL